MSKYKWHKYRRDKGNDITILHWGRRVGKTATMIRMLEMNPRAILIVPNHHLVRSVQERTNACDRVIAPDQYNDRYKEVYIDEAGMVSEELIALLARQKRLKAMSFTSASPTVAVIAHESKRYDNRQSRPSLILRAQDEWAPRDLDDLYVPPLQ